MTVQVRAPPAFDISFDEEARFIGTFTPAFYVNYNILQAALGPDGGWANVFNLATVHKIKSSPRALLSSMK